MAKRWEELNGEEKIEALHDEDKAIAGFLDTQGMLISQLAAKVRALEKKINEDED